MYTVNRFLIFLHDNSFLQFIFILNKWNMKLKYFWNEDIQFYNVQLDLLSYNNCFLILDK